MTTDWQTTRGAQMLPGERAWIMRKSAEMAGRFEKPVIVHIGVEYGASLVCSQAGAPDARIVGIDLDTSKFLGEKEGIELVQEDSTKAAQGFHNPVHFLFVDGDHEEQGVRSDMRSWLGKVRPGGLAVFHDYTQDLEAWPHVAGVRTAIDAWDWADTTWEHVPAPGSLFAMKRRPFLKRGDGFGTIGLGVPYMKAEYDFFRWWSWLLVGGLNDGDQLLNDESFECPAPIPVIHNALIQRFLLTDRDTFCMVEDDHCGSQDIIRQMRSKEANWDFDVVCANYVNRRGLPVPIGYNWMSVQPSGELLVQIDFANTETTGTQEAGGAAMGLFLARRWVLDAMLAGRDPALYQWCEWKGRNSQDLWFYWKAHEVGARAGVDRDARLGHVGKRIWTFDDFISARQRAKERVEVTSDGTL